ncbi:4-hydroxy-3-methylbut-2-enyl diphosphate reductase [Leucobacter komagatae]|uniref:4-hydroxy-3-methylbut-2-enyl diphosphate reductase n=2 Tax=Leucobacter komagatae TaxID=55969 RepID=A0A542XY54_9MICO|nr:4-hydroxy-3-methylbut-2-enyl diphosphate reductase [Leucobacter komagatae]
MCSAFQRRLVRMTEQGSVVDQRTVGAPVVSLAMPRMRRLGGRLKNEPVDGDKRVLLAAPRGYCAGVDRAVVAVEKALDRFGAPVYVRKQIVHNVHVVQTLEKMGAIFVEEVEEVPEGANVVFSAHGVSPAVVQAAEDRHLHAIDATCPLVTKVHREAVRFAKQDMEILLIGHTGHEEVEGTAGEAPDHITIVNSPDDVDDLVVRDPDRLVWLSQTTLSVDETMETVRRLRERFPNLQDPPSDDICYATQNRQVAIKKIAPEADLVLVVGSTNSSNSVRLVEVALEYGAKAAYLVDFAEEVKQEWLEGVKTIGISSGASVPEVLVQELLDDLGEAGYSDVSAVVTAEEDLVFSLPKELRQDASGKRDARALGGRVR